MDPPPPPLLLLPYLPLSHAPSHKVNGQYQPILQAQPGEALRLRIVHAGNNDHMYLYLLPSSRQNQNHDFVNRSSINGSATSTTAETGGRQGKRKSTENGGVGGHDEEENDKPGRSRKRLLGGGGSEQTAGLASRSDRDGSTNDHVSNSSNKNVDAGQQGSGDGCTLLTLARDGVYLRTPRRQGGGKGHLVIAPGSRADVAVLCDKPGVYRLASWKGPEDGQELPMTYLGSKTDVFEGKGKHAVGRGGMGGWGWGGGDYTSEIFCFYWSRSKYHAVCFKRFN